MSTCKNSDSAIVLAEKHSGENLRTPYEKLRTLYNLIKQFYIRSCEAIITVRGWEKPPERMAAILKELSTVPEWIKIHKESACRKGVLHGFTLAKAYHPELKPELLAGGFPQFKVDGSEFTKEDYQAVMKETHHHACAIARGIDLNNYQSDYDEHKKKINLQLPVPFELVSKNQNPAAPSSSQAPASSGSSSTPAQPQASVGDVNEETLQALHQIFRPGSTGGDDAGDEITKSPEGPREEPVRSNPAPMED